MEMVKVHVPKGMDPESFVAGFQAAMEIFEDILNSDDDENEEEDKQTCRGCKHNIVVNDTQVCWRTFCTQGSGVHTVPTITDEHTRCEHYEARPAE